MSPSLFASILLLAHLRLTLAHMSAFTPAMYGLGHKYTYDAGQSFAPPSESISLPIRLSSVYSNSDTSDAACVGDPVAPMHDMSLYDWWFRYVIPQIERFQILPLFFSNKDYYLRRHRIIPILPVHSADSVPMMCSGPAARALTPAGRKNNLAILPAGGSFQLDIACHAAWSGLGWRTTRPGSYLDACPNGKSAYHMPEKSTGLPSYSGCALAIADVDDISKTNMDNLVVFSVIKDCVKQKENHFPVPKAMPKCTGKKCICGWFWLADQVSSSRIYSNRN